MADSSEESGKMSSAALRRIKKPLIERRRRVRINESLNQLKSLVLEAMNKDESRYSKMEKADILEMTVKHLKVVQKDQVVMRSSHDLVDKYRAGYSECIREVGRYISGVETLNGDVRGRLYQHLSNVANGQQNNGPTTTMLPCANVINIASSGVQLPVLHMQPQQMRPAATVAPMVHVAAPPSTSPMVQSPISCGTPVSSLPGSPACSPGLPSPRAYSNSPSPRPSSACSSISSGGYSETKPLSINVAVPPVMAVLSPTQVSPQGQGQNSQGHMLNNAIPLYINAAALTQAQHNNGHCVDINNNNTPYPDQYQKLSQSPKTGDEFPTMCNKGMMASTKFDGTHCGTRDLSVIKCGYEKDDCVWRPW